MNPRLTTSAAVAVVAASLSLNAVVQGNGWLFAGIGAVLCAALAGTLTRLGGIRAAAGAAFLVLIVVMPLLTAHTWYPRIGGVLIVAVIAASGFAGRLPRLVAALASYLALLLIYLNLVFEPGKSFAGVIPTQGSLAALSRLPGQAAAQFHYLPPISDIPPVSFFAAAGIGLIAICVDILAVGLRRPAIAGLPLLALFSVPVASNIKGFGLGEWLTFAAGLGGFLLLLSSDGRQRLRMWGRLVAFRYVQPTDEAGPGPDTRDIAASGRRIGLAAVCLAIVIPAVLPGMHVHDVFGGAADGSGSGTGGSGAAGPVAPLLQVQRYLQESTPQPVLTYKTSLSAKQTPEQYLQLYALNYDPKSDEWLYGSLTGRYDKPVLSAKPLPQPVPGLAHGVPVSKVTTTVYMSDKYNAIGSAVLPMPYAPDSLKLESNGSWTETPSLTVYSGTQLMAGLIYTVGSTEASPTAAEENYTESEVPASIMKAYGTYGGPDASELKSIAQSLTAGVSSPFLKAKALQNYFLSKFTYTLKPGLPARGWLLDFLTHDKRGFCQQFSWAFAVLARLLGIPTRIAVGYTAGTALSNGKWVVTTADAHAWPEVYVPQVGWVRFEPTPSANGQGTADVPPYAQGAVPGSPYTTPSNLGSGHHTTNPSVTNPGGNPGNHLPAGPKTKCDARLDRNAVTGLCAASGGAGSLDAPSKPGFPWPVLIPIVLVLLLAFPGLGRLAIRRKRWLSASGDADLAHAAWRELTDDLDDYGLTSQPSESPRALTRRINKDAELNDAGREALARIGTAEERARYAVSAWPGGSLRRDVHTVRRAIAADSTRSQRLRAVLMPASTVAAIRRGLQRAGDLFGWLDTSMPAMQRELRLRQHQRSVRRGSGQQAA
jgi:TgpA N-terminal domain/Transglutaminase-like superfamily